MITKPKHKGIILLLGLIILTLLNACDKSIIVPAINDISTNTYHPGKFVWHDLFTNDVSSSKEFYSKLFNWEFEDDDEANSIFTLIKFNGKRIGGIVDINQLKQEVKRPRWLAYISVPDVAAAVKEIESKGGFIFADTRELRNRGTIAIFSDPQGAPLALLESSSGDPIDAEPKTGEWLWNELWTSDTKAAIKFYSNLVGYESDLVDSESDVDYTVLRKEDKLRAGVFKMPLEEHPDWLPYIAVEDPEATIKLAEQLGATILMNTETITGDKSAVIADPTGAVFSIQKWPVDTKMLKEKK